VGMDDEGKVIEKSIFKEDNILAAHKGMDIEKVYGSLIKSYHGTEPLVIFQGHIHSINVLREYKWLSYDDKVHFIKVGVKHFYLDPGTAYWISPGRACYIGSRTETINFAIYDPKERLVILKSVPTTF
jgi:hypothetical protein